MKSLDELMDDRMALADEIDELERQIKLAEARGNVERVYADPEWWADSHFRLKKMRRRYDHLNQAVSIARKRENRNVEKTKERLFIREVYERFHEDDLRAIWARIRLDPIDAEIPDPDDLDRRAEELKRSEGALKMREAAIGEIFDAVADAERIFIANANVSRDLFEEKGLSSSWIREASKAFGEVRSLVGRFLRNCK